MRQKIKVPALQVRLDACSLLETCHFLKCEFLHSLEYVISTTVQSSLRGVLPQNSETAAKMSCIDPFFAATSRRSLSKNSPCAFSASVTPSVTRTRRSPGCKL